jgi:hypothetical protein
MSTRLQLHSSLGRLQLVAGGYFFVPLALVHGVTWLQSVLRHGLRPTSFAMWAVIALVYFYSGWCRRNATRVFATASGLELGDLDKTVPWSAVVEVRQLQWPSLIPVYRVTFGDGTPPLTFYANESVEQVVARFQRASTA